MVISLIASCQPSWVCIHWSELVTVEKDMLTETWNAAEPHTLLHWGSDCFLAAVEEPLLPGLPEHSLVRTTSSSSGSSLTLQMDGHFTGLKSITSLSPEPCWYVGSWREASLPPPWSRKELDCLRELIWAKTLLLVSKCDETVIKHRAEKGQIFL